MTFRALWILGAVFVASGVASLAIGRALAVRDQARHLPHTDPDDTLGQLIDITDHTTRAVVLDGWDSAQDLAEIERSTPDDIGAAVERLARTMGEQA